MAQQASRASSQVFVSSQLSPLRSQEGSHMFTFYSSNSKLKTATIMKYQASYPQSRRRLSEKEIDIKLSITTDVYNIYEYR